MASWLKRIINKILGRQSEEAYYARLLKYGRIIEGEVIDAQHEGADIRIFYTYSISTVQYESSQLLRPEQLSQSFQYQPGITITVRFDPRYPGRSVVQ